MNDVRDREFLLFFHKKANKVGLDVAKYNQLRIDVNRIEGDLKRLRDPLRLHSALHSHPATADERPSPGMAADTLWDRIQMRASNLLRPSKE